MYTPDDTTKTKDLSDVEAPPWYAPFKSASAYRVVEWSQTNETSQAATDKLVREVMRSPDFDPSELDGFSMQRELDRISEQPKEASIDDLMLEGSMDAILEEKKA